MAISEQTFHLDPDFPGTLQQQVQRTVTDGVLAGRFRPADRLPSTRRLAAHLGISRITVTLAYTELLANDYLTARGRSGYFISQTAPRPPDFGARASGEGDGVDWSRAIGHRFTGTKRLERPGDWAQFPDPFICGQTDTRLFDHRNWRLCALQPLGDAGVLIEPGGVFFDPATPDRCHHRLAYSSIPADRIEAGVARLAAALAEPVT